MAGKLSAPFPPEVKAIVSYIGSRKRTVNVYEKDAKDCRPMALHSYWDGGSRSQYALFRNGSAVHIPVNGHPYFDASGRKPREYTPQPGDILIRYGTTNGNPATPSLTYFR